MDKFIFTQVNETELCILLERFGYANEKRELNGNPNGVLVVGTHRQEGRHYSRYSKDLGDAKLYEKKSIAVIRQILKFPDGA